MKVVTEGFPTWSLRSGALFPITVILLKIKARPPTDARRIACDAPSSAAAPPSNRKPLTALLT
jgi:hypothetical protein